VVKIDKEEIEETIEKQTEQDLKREPELEMACPYCGNVQQIGGYEIILGTEFFTVDCVKCKKEYEVSISYKAEKIKGLASREE